MLGTKTARPTPTPPSGGRRLLRPVVVFTAAALVAVAVIVPLAILGGDDGDVADQPAVSTATTVAPTTTTIDATTTLATTTLGTTTATTDATTTSTAPLSGLAFDWTSAELDPSLFPGEGDIRGVAATASGFVAVGWDAEDCGLIWASSDGTGWEPATLPAANAPCGQLLQGMAAAGERAVAYGGGGDGPIVWMSENGGRDWREVPATDVPFLPGSRVRAVAADDDGFVFSTTSEGASGLWYTSDAVVWYQSETPAEYEIYHLSSGPNGFIALGRGPRYVTIGGVDTPAFEVLVSSDGRTWSLAEPVEGIGPEGERCAPQLRAPASGPNGYVIAGPCVGVPGTAPVDAVWHSPDGVTWTQVEIDGPGVPVDEARDEVWAAAGDESAFVLAGYSMILGDGRVTAYEMVVWYSDDGYEWTRVVVAGDASAWAYPRGAAMSDGTVVVVGRHDPELAIWTGVRR